MGLVSCEDNLILAIFFTGLTFSYKHFEPNNDQTQRPSHSVPSQDSWGHGVWSNPFHVCSKRELALMLIHKRVLRQMRHGVEWVLPLLIWTFASD